MNGVRFTLVISKTEMRESEIFGVKVGSFFSLSGFSRNPRANIAEFRNSVFDFFVSRQSLELYEQSADVFKIEILWVPGNPKLKNPKMDLNFFVEYGQSKP